MAASTHITAYTNLFTLASNDPATNRYVDMFFIWLSYLIRKGKPDAAYLMIDSRTYAYIASTPLFAFLSSKINFPMYALTYNPPATLKEGTLHRFEIERFGAAVAPATVFLYLDIDVLPIRPLHGLIGEVKSNCLYYSAESIPTDKKYVFLDDNYFGHLATVEDVAWLEASFGETGVPGITSGIFAFTAGEQISEFFKYIRTAAAADQRQFYTLDQPFYVAAIYQFIMRTSRINHVGICPDHLRVNMPAYDAPSSVILLNFCGDPGDESSHWFKMFSELVADAAF